MAFLDQAFDVENLPQSDNKFEPLPAGWYSATIQGAELKNTKAGNGQYIALKYAITGPTHQGRIIFGNLNIKNPNPKAEEIGRQQLGDVMRAIGLAKVTDTDQLIGGSLSIKLAVKEDEYGGNEVKGCKSLTGSIPPAPKMAAASAPAESPAKSSPPWAKK